MNYYVYIQGYKRNNKLYLYVGSHCHSDNEGFYDYKGSGSVLADGFEWVTKHILQYYDSIEEMYAGEVYWIRRFAEKFGVSGWVYKHYNDSIQYVTDFVQKYHVNGGLLLNAKCSSDEQLRTQYSIIKSIDVQVAKYGCLAFHQDYAKQKARELNHARLLGTGIVFDRTDESYIYKVSKNQEDLWKDPEYRESQTNAIKNACNDPGYLAELSRKCREAKSTEEYRQTNSDNMKKLWADPEYRERQTKALKDAKSTPEARLHNSQAQTKVYRLSNGWEGTKEDLNQMLVDYFNKPHYADAFDAWRLSSESSARRTPKCVLKVFPDLHADVIGKLSERVNCSIESQGSNFTDEEIQQLLQN